MTKQYNQDKYYTLSNAATQPQEIDETKECMQVVIEHVRARHMNNFMSTNLKVMNTILLDLEEIRQESPAAHETALLALTMYPASYAKIGERRKVSKVAIFTQIERLSKRYDWIADIKANMCQ